MADEDLQLALYCCYELHYRGLPGVDERWEWEPSLLAARARAGGAVRGRDASGSPGRRTADCAPEELDLALRALADADDGAVAVALHRARGDAASSCASSSMHRSAYQLKEADPHSWAIPRLSGPPKAALVEIQADEYGGGRPERMHARLFADAMSALGLDPAYGAYLDRLPGRTLATVNLMSLFGLHRRLRGAIVGHLALFEMTSSLPNRALRARPAPARVRRPGRDGLLRRARRGRRGPREHRGGRPRRRPGAPGAGARGPDPLGRPRAARDRGALGGRAAGRVGGGRELAAGPRWRRRPRAVLGAARRAEADELVRAVAERAHARAPAAAEGDGCGDRRRSPARPGRRAGRARAPAADRRDTG